MSAEQVAVIPAVRRVQPALVAHEGDRWQAYFDTDDELVFYCPDCAEREFRRP